MNMPLSPVVAVLLATTLAACSSGSTSGPTSSGNGAAPGERPGPDAPSTPGTPGGGGGGGGGGDDGGPAGPAGPPGSPPFIDPATRLPPTAGLPAPVLAELDTFTGPLPTPSADDFFFTRRDVDPEAPAAGGPPTTPKHLRIDLISNDWAEFSWAPSNDDGEVVAYEIVRSDGHVYTIRGDQSDPRRGTQAEIERYWRTTSFIDCNYTRFADTLHDCGANGPAPGDMFSYQVVAVDDEGQRSAMSSPIAIRYHDTVGAPVSPIGDPYLGENPLALTEDLTNSAHFLDRFRLVFEDEFDRGRIDGRFWNTELLWGDTRVINGEQQYFVSTQRAGDPVAAAYDPFSFASKDVDGDGDAESIMTISAIPTPASVVDALPPICRELDPSYATRRCAFLSGALSSHDRLNLTYGYVEGRMRASGGAGALSSFYLYHRYEGTGRNYHAPEIDILEYLGENPFGDEDAFQTYHYGDTSAFVTSGERITRTAPTMSHAKPEGDLYSDAFHTYAVLWEPQLVIWYIDGREIKRLSGPQVSRQGMNIVAYLVAGSGWAPTPDVTDPDLFPLRFEIDWIRAWQRDGYATTGLYPERD